MDSFPGFPPGVTRPLMSPEEYLNGPPGYLANARIRKILPEGNGSSGILALGEAGGQNEASDGLPFRPYAEAGSVLERALFRAGVPRETLTLTNLVWYQPPRNWLEGAPWEAEAIRSCWGMNDELIERVKPRVFLALGGLPFRELTGLSGEKLGITSARGFICPSLGYPGIPVIGTYHPSFLRRGSKERESSGPKGKVVAAGGGTQGMSLLGVLIRDIQLAAIVARNGAPKFQAPEYVLGATLTEWEDAFYYLKAHPEVWVCYDFETKDSLQKDDESEIKRTVTQVTQVQVSWKPGQALVSPWSGDLWPALKSILELPNPKLDWNGRKFDRPILRDMNIRCDLGEWHDGMDLWHHTQPDLPRGLQYATSFFCPEVGPWKHLSGSDPLVYGAYDVDMPQRIFAGLRTSMQLSREPHSGVSLWGDGKYGGYLGQVVKLSPVLDRMSARGIPVDEDRRGALDTEFSATLSRLSSEMQSLFPDELRSMSPKAGYVREPKETKGLVQRGFTVEVKCGCYWSQPAKRKLKLVEADCQKCGNTGTVVERVFRWVKLLEFLPGSWQQVLSYCKWRREQDLQELTAHNTRRSLMDDPRAWAEQHTVWKIPTDYKTGSETTGEAGLRRLANATGDPLLPMVLDYREVSKAKGTYVDGWAPSDVEKFVSACPVCNAFPGDNKHAEGCQEFFPESRIGRVHPNFGFKPATPQLSSDSPNAQNFPQHAQIAQAMKAMIRASPGKVMIKFDWKSFHVLTLGFEAQDPDYMRLARLDMHSFFAAAGLLRLVPPQDLLRLSDADLSGQLAEYRKSTCKFPEFGGLTFQQIRDEKAKRAILGVGFGQQERSLYMLNPESFASISEAKRTLDVLNKELFPKPEAWRRAVRIEADDRHELMTRFGAIRRFWDVYHRKPVAANYQARNGETIVEDRSGRRWLLKPGDDHEAVVAFRPAADAFGIKRQVMVQLGEREWDERYGLIVEIHDDLRFECPQALADSCLQDVKALMESPSPYLVDPVVAPQGLWCAVEPAIGPDWSKMEKLS